MSMSAAQLHVFQDTRSHNDPKPLSETEYVKKLKEEVARREREEGGTLGF